jgi:hypothetical protein
LFFKNNSIIIPVISCWNFSKSSYLWSRIIFQVYIRENQVKTNPTFNLVEWIIFSLLDFLSFETWLEWVFHTANDSTQLDLCYVASLPCRPSLVPSPLSGHEKFSLIVFHRIRVRSLEGCKMELWIFFSWHGNDFFIIKITHTVSQMMKGVLRV